MTVWLKLTASSGAPLLVNMDRAVSVREVKGGGCFVDVGGTGDGFIVTESLASIARLLETRGSWT